MQTQSNRTGRCLCGDVSFALTLTDGKAHVCHCGMCRKSGAGGPCISVDCKDVVFRNEGKLRWYQSSEYAQRGFCHNCGSFLFFRMMDGSGYMNVSAAVLDDDTGITIRDHIYIDSKPPYYDFADNCPRLTEAQTIAKFQGDNA